MPARWVPLLYFGFAHLCLAVAFAALAGEPRALAGFYYHPRMLAVVHLVTLGWISASILGAVYLIGPLAFRMPMPARWADYAVFAGFAVGVIGMATFFWIDGRSGVPWAAGLVAAAMAYVASRVLRGLRSAPVPLEARLPMALAFVNLLLAAGLGVVLGANKLSPFLPVAHLDAVLAHAHLAALGFAAMTVVGAGYRILPMILPAAMPRGVPAYAAPLLLEGGVAGLVWSLLTGRGLFTAAALTVAGVLVFVSRVVWMLRHRRPAPTELRRPDWGTAHVLQSFVYLLGACGAGLYLSAAAGSERTLALAAVYGVLGLVGFLSQIIVGVEARLLPLFAWLWGFADRGHAEMPPSLHTAAVRPLQGIIFCLWTAGVPLLAVGLGSGRLAALSFGAAALLGAVLASLSNAAVVLVRLWVRRGEAAA